MLTSLFLLMVGTHLDTCLDTSAYAALRWSWGHMQTMQRVPNNTYVLPCQEIVKLQYIRIQRVSYNASLFSDNTV